MIKILTYILLCIVSSQTLANNYFTNQKDVQLFIDHMVKKNHFQKQELITLFNAVKIRKMVVHHVRKPLEEKPWYLYQLLFVTESRIRNGVKFWNKHQKILERAEKVYGVPASIIVATIGIETKYGKSVGEYRVIDALVNLGFSASPRAGFFRNELEQFLLLSREQHLNPLKIMGSYAGAIGQPQFMPSSYRYYAVNFSGNKHIDLSNNEEDIIGSIANFYKKHGWQSNQPIIIPAKVSGYRYQSLLQSADSSPLIPVSHLLDYGIYPQDSLSPNQKVLLVRFKEYYQNSFWVGFRNYLVIKQYNPSNLYAMSVYQLSYYISALKRRLKDD